MKYLITESQLDKFIFKYINLKRFIQIKKGDKIYFVNSENDEYAQIMYHKKEWSNSIYDGWCFININLIREISSFFSLERNDSEKVIGKWVENTIQMDVTITYLCFGLDLEQLRIPYK
jgi:hypothetical protein